MASRRCRRRRRARVRRRCSTGCSRPRRRAGAQLSAGPVFDLSAGLPRDTIRRRDVRRLYPFENTLRTIRVTGEQLRAYLEQSAEYFRVDPAGRVSLNEAMAGYDFDIVRGARYEWICGSPSAAGSGVSRSAAGGGAAGQVHDGDQQPSADRLGGLRDDRGRAGGLRQGRAHPGLLEDEVRRRRPIPRTIAPSEWRIVPEVSAMAVREIYDIAPPPLPRLAARHGGPACARHRGAARAWGRRPARSTAPWTAWARTATARPCGSTAAARRTGRVAAGRC